MTGKPTYDELERRVRRLEAERDRLAAVEADLQTFFEMSLDLLCIADIRTATFVKVNPAFSATLGYGEADLLGRPFMDFIHPQDVAPTRQVIEESLLRGEKVINFRNRYRCRDGGYRWLNWVSHRLPDKGLTYAVAHDVTEETLAQEALRSQRDLLDSLFDNIALGVTVWEGSGRLRMRNEAFTELTGYGEEDIADLDGWFANAHPDPALRREARAKWQAARASNSAVLELAVTCKDGTVKDIEFRGTFMEDGRDLVTLVDVTERRRAREELIRRRKFLESVLYHAPDAIVTLDAEHRVVDWNPGAVKIFGYTPEETFGRPLDELVAGGKQSAEAGAKTRQVLSGRRVEAFATVRYRKDGTPRDVIAAGSPILVDGVLAGVVAVYTDITEMKKMEEGLRRAQKMEAIGTLAGGIAHDFNNLLTGIQGHASLMGVDLDPGDPLAPHVAAIEEHVRSAVGLTRQLLGVVRGGKYEVRPVDVRVLVDASAAMFGRTRKEIRIHPPEEGPPLVVEADRRQLEQVLLNLFVNAWQAMPDGGDLHLAVQAVDLAPADCEPHGVPPGPYLRISVTDTGVGMDEPTRQRVFDPFFTTRAKARGTGLGLASAYGIVRNHGGLITVYSEPGRGTTFNVYLPRSAQAAATEAPAERSLRTGTETVLLVDDEALIVEVGSALLERLGYRVRTADGGEAAVAAVAGAGDALDLVILDLIMPDMDGGATFDRIRALRPDLPVILSSGYSINGQAAEIMGRGCEAFIQKPFDIVELSRKVREALDGARVVNSPRTGADKRRPPRKETGGRPDGRGADGSGAAGQGRTGSARRPPAGRTKRRRAMNPQQSGGSGQGRGGGRGKGGGGGQGRGPGRGGGRGPGTCVCPQCGHRLPHQRGAPCFEQDCPQCGAKMIRE